MLCDRPTIAMVLAHELESQCDAAANESWRLYRSYDLPHEKEKNDSSFTLVVTSGAGDTPWNIQRMVRFQFVLRVGGEKWQEFLVEEVRVAYLKLRARELY